MILDKLVLYFEYPFVRYALAAGVLIALCSSLIGVTLVLKRFSFIGDGLSHVAFGALAVATIFDMSSSMPLVMCITVACAILLLRTGQNTKIKGDAAVAMLSVGSLAAGYMLMNIFSSSANISGDVCSTLFGSTSILTLSVGDVWLCAAMSMIVIVFFVLFYNKIFAVTFDETFARIVLAMNLVGSLLISALVIFPALSSMRIFRTFRSVIICSAALSVICSTAGILLAVLVGTPVGSTIVVVQIAVFIVFYAVGALKGGIGK